MLPAVQKAEVCVFTRGCEQPAVVLCCSYLRRDSFPENAKFLPCCS